MVISMIIIPLVARLAPRIGLIDRPDPRKVHAVPVPRAGGVGIVLGALVPLAIWLPIDDLSSTYFFGALILLFFGTWDDISELGHYVKFIGQIIAVVPIVYYGDLYITHFPFMGLETIPESVGKPLTVFAIMGMINAINHSDGLDGLAGGMSLLSLGCIAYLAYLADGVPVMLVALATLGGVFGFLRYNTHPARVFMGDSGSQFLGFTSGFLAVFLIEKVNPTLSYALPALFLGLPIADILGVFVQRAYHGMNWFRATRNHIHHRLLQLGFDHHEAVIAIYSVQILFIVSAILLSYESDFLILSIYLGVCFLIFILLTAAEHRGWRAHGSSRTSKLTWVIHAIKKNRLFVIVPAKIVTIAIPLLFFLVSLLAEKIPGDFGFSSAVLAAILLFFIMTGNKKDSIVVQAIHYVTAAFIVYLETKFFGRQIPSFNVIEVIYFVVLAMATGLAIRYAREVRFSTTPMDYLVIFLILFAGILLHNMPEKADIGFMAVKLAVLFYGCELIVSQMRRNWSLMNLSTLGTLVILTVRGWI